VIVQGDVEQSLLTPTVTFADGYPGHKLASKINNRYVNHMNLFDRRLFGVGMGFSSSEEYLQGPTSSLRNEIVTACLVRN